MSNERAFGHWEACSNLVRTSRNGDGRGGFLVAECPANTGNSIENARLIAAAPELLSALEDLLKHVEANCVTDCSEAKAAIAKARGE